MRRVFLFVVTLQFLIALGEIRADLATPFVDTGNKKGDVSVTHGFVVALGPEIGERFMVIIIDDGEQPVVLWATAKKGIIKESLLGREVLVKARISKEATARAKPQLEILQATPLKIGS